LEIGGEISYETAKEALRGNIEVILAHASTTQL
jgi:hypothetical protein